MLYKSIVALILKIIVAIIEKIIAVFVVQLIHIFMRPGLAKSKKLFIELVVANFSTLYKR